jgi:hypothetical protein
VVLLQPNHKILWKLRADRFPGELALVRSSPAIAAARAADPANTGRIVTGERAVTGRASTRPRRAPRFADDAFHAADFGVRSATATGTPLPP